MLLVVFVAGCIIAVSLSVLGGSSKSIRDVTVRDRLASHGQWSQELADKQSQYSAWLDQHGAGFEVKLFEDISSLIFRSAEHFAGERGELSIFSRLCVSALFAFLRLAFVIIACWRVWVAALVIAVVVSHFGVKPYIADDILGQTGNSRMFYSGIRASLDHIDSEGRPTDQVVGLACPASVSLAVAKASEIGKLLEKYGAGNKTNLSLAGIILHYVEYPAYVADKEEQSMLNQVFEGGNLAENTFYILKAVLGYHKNILDSGGEPEGSSFTARQGTPLANGEVPKMTSKEYAELLGKLFSRVLTPSFRESLSRLSAAEVATAILAHEAGKILTYSFEGGRWLRKSSFGQLNARAILHSVADYAKEYSLDTRNLLRKAIIYGSRKSVFAPVRFAVDLSEEARALRQWVELLMANPHEVYGVADEVELVGLIHEGHKVWLRAFFDGAMILSPEVVEGVYASSANLLFMPVQKIVSIMRKIISADTLRRMETLISLVNQKQKIRDLSLNLSDEADESGVATSKQDRFLAPLAHKEMQELGKLHNVSQTDLKDWSSLRVILNYYSWLARRVGDMTVPESSVVFAVFKTDHPMPESNDIGLIGKSSMVPLRASRLMTRWGRSWSTRFIQVGLANMAESQEDYERLLKGEDYLENEEISEGGTSMPA